MKVNDLTYDDKRVIVESIDPDWRDHFDEIEHAWNWYERTDELLTAIENYERQEIKMFEFLLDAKNYKDRKVDRSGFDWGYISTAYVSDGKQPFVE